MPRATIETCPMLSPPFSHAPRFPCSSSANLCRLFSKAGNMLVEEAGDDIRASACIDSLIRLFRLGAVVVLMI